MKNKKILYLICMIFLLMLNQSCLEMGLDKLPLNSDALITNINFEYRWAENNSLKVMRLNTSIVSKNPDTQGITAVVKITVPAASASFPVSVRNNVTLNNLAAYFDISPGATVIPIGNTPQLGTIGNFSGSNLQYKVVAANGDEKIWTLTIENFVK